MILYLHSLIVCVDITDVKSIQQRKPSNNMIDFTLCYILSCLFTLYYILSQYAFPLYGFLWYFMGDFLPRGGSTIALALLMRQSDTAAFIEKKEVCSLC